MYRKVKLSLDSGRKTLFTGLPCEVAALYGFLGRQYDNLTTCELICAGPSSYLLYEAQKDWIHEKYGSNVKTFSFRYKKYGWVPCSLQAVMQNSHEYSKMFEETLFGVGMKYAKRVACYNCKYKGEKRLGDFTIGDFWEIDRKSQCYNEMGTSVVFARTGKALELIQRISSFRSYEVNAEYAAKGNKQQLSYAVDVPAQREEFMNMLKTERPDIVFRSFKPQKTLVKSIKNKLPAPIYRLLRKYIGF